MLNTLTPEQLVLVAGAITGIIGALTAAWVSVTKANAEAARMRAEVAAIRTDMAEDREVAEKSQTSRSRAGLSVEVHVGLIW